MSNIHNIVTRLRETFDNGKTRSFEFRKKQLENLRKMFEDNSDKIFKSLEQDLKKSKTESFHEINIFMSEIDFSLENLKHWMTPEKPEKNLITFFDKVRIYKEPKGVVLVIGAWNYAVVTLMPIVGAIAAGNTILIKPSELAPATGNTLAELIATYLDQECFAVLLGGVEETTEILKEKFDHIMFTGSSSVGRIIHAAANRNLTPVTLELGGKSPCFIDETVNIEFAVRRIMWGKCVNAGQTCIAPDYLLCTKDVQEKFVKEVKKVIKKWYGTDVSKSSDLCRIISDKHFQRLENLLKDCEIAFGGDSDANTRYFGPTVLTNVRTDHPIMMEEIFGPILPIVPVASALEAIKFVNDRERPLTAYIFTLDKNIQDLFIENTISGSAVINDTLIHFGVPTLPFGGIGESGMGVYRGKYSFETFTHKKSVIVKNFSKLGEKLTSARYPPYSDKKLEMMKKLLQIKVNFSLFKYVPYTLLIGIGIAIGIILKNYQLC